MNLEQAANKGAVLSGSILFPILANVDQQKKEQMTIVMNSRKEVKMIDICNENFKFLFW